MTPVLFDVAKDSVALLAALHEKSFPEAWDEKAIRDLLAGPAFAFFTQDGFVLARVAGGEAEILTLAVAPEARGRGLGRALIEAACGHAAHAGAREIFLEVGADNPPALALYAGLGFARVGSRKAYYRSPGAASDAWVLRLSLKRDFA